MMRLKGLTLALCALMVLPAQASTRDEIARLQQGPARASTPVRWMTLSNGQRVNLNDWTVVLFMQGHCPYCQRFDPLLKALSDRHGFAVFAYTFDGQGDEAFPEAIPAPAAVMRTFFPGLPVASPTTFLVNVTTLAAFPLLQGASDEAGFMARLDTVLRDAARGGVR